MSKRLVLFTCIVMVLGTVAASTAFADRTVLADDSCRTKMEKLDENDHSNRLVVRVGNGDPTRTFKSWLKFNISGIDVQGLASATLVFASRRDRGPCSLDVSYVHDDVVENIEWTSDDITWNNAPGNDPCSETALDPDETTFIDRAVLEEGAMHDQFMVDALEALQTDTDGIVQFVLHNSSAYLNIVAHDEGDEQHLPFVPALILVQGSSPYDGEVDVPQDTDLSWLKGDYADTFDVYFSTDFNDVNEATVDNPLDVLVSTGREETTYVPTELLEFTQTYYWRIDEVNDAEPNSPIKGDVLSFTTANFIVLEDFEDYNDFQPNTVWDTWSDGYGIAGNGSSAGYPDPDFVGGEHYMEMSIIHGGSQSMPLFYDNRIAPISEVSRPFSAPLNNWNRDNVVTLTLFYHGDPGNAAEPMFVVVDGAVVTNDDANAALLTEWTQWDIPLQEFADQGVNLSNVGSMSIGFGNKANPTAGGGSGHVFFDDARLYREE